MQIFIIAEGLKIEFCGIISSLVQTFCESCEQLDITHPSDYMIRRFVIQGCPTLKKKNIKNVKGCTTKKYANKVV